MSEKTISHDSDKKIMCPGFYYIEELTEIAIDVVRAYKAMKRARSSIWNYFNSPYHGPFEITYSPRELERLEPTYIAEKMLAILDSLVNQILTEISNVDGQEIDVNAFPKDIRKFSINRKRIATEQYNKGLEKVKKVENDYI